MIPIHIRSSFFSTYTHYHGIEIRYKTNNNKEEVRYLWADTPEVQQRLFDTITNIKVMGCSFHNTFTRRLGDIFPK